LRQLSFMAIGLPFFILFLRMPSDITQKLSFVFLTILYLLLLLNPFLGASVRGSVRWFNLGFFSFQPSELIKPFLIMCLAAVFGRGGFTPKNFAVSLLLVIPGVILTLLQPDLGTALVLIFAFAIIVINSGIKPLAAGILGALGAGTGLLGFLFGLKDYQRRRLEIFINPESDPLGAGYSVLQSRIAVGSGRLLGKGFGQGSQSHLNFLPESKTDFVFSSLAEEWGFIGSSLIVGLLFLMCYGILYKLRQIKERTGKLFFLGVWAVVIFQVFVNIGMNLGIMPVTGIPLPFVSSGGSSLLAFLIMFGMLSGIAREDRLL